MTTRLVKCCDCGLTKPAGAFNWNSRTHRKNACRRTCGRGRRVKLALRVPAQSVFWRKPNLSMSILGKE